MVRVEFSRCGGTYVLRMTGHAGQADVGHDVVCAAATILCYTVAQTALDLYEQGKLRKRPRVDIGKGDATVTLCHSRSENLPALCREADIQLLYHNHDFEFITLSGQYGLDFLYSSVPACVRST